MTGMDGQLLLGLAVPAVGVVVWLIRLEGRIDKNEALQKDMKDDLVYIRDRVDTIAGMKK
jgi:hypothetical protein